jgi:site-specific recombinase XerD
MNDKKDPKENTETLKTAKFSVLPHVSHFLTSILANNYSTKTHDSYKRDLVTFDRFLASEMSHLSFNEIDKHVIELFKAHLNSDDRQTALNKQITENRLKSGSINRMLSSLRRYFTYLVDMDHESPIAPTAIKLVRAEKKHGQVAELHELISLIESPMKFEKNKFVAARNRAMLETLFASGMRISELLGLRLNQLDKSGRLFIQGKGKKQRFIYLTDRAREHIDNYLKLRVDDHPYLFIPKRGANASEKNSRLSPNYLQMKIKKYRELLGINVPTSAHSLRHGFATYLAEQGANPAAIQILLGHESLDTTTRYVHASDKYAEETHRKFHPLSK